MKTSNIFLIILFIATLNSCLEKPQNLPSYSSLDAYQQAKGKMKAVQYDSALYYLRIAFQKGFDHPMCIIQDSSFYTLIDSSSFRTKLRALLKEFSSNSIAKMVRNKEPGFPIDITGQIVDEVTLLPIENASVELVQTDSMGFYFNDDSLWNPRIFCFLQTDKDGFFSVSTIYPGSYLDEENRPIPAHIHFNIEKESYRPYGSEFTFENDSILKKNGNTDHVIVAKFNSGLTDKLYQLVIPIQKSSLR